jgi:transcriptional regulator with XRE-family HTH domain
VTGPLRHDVRPVTFPLLLLRTGRAGTPRDDGPQGTALSVQYDALVSDEVQATLTALIGGRVRQERQSKGWTLDQLAAASGVSRRMLVSVEQGAANPSVGTLLRISDALGVGLPALVKPVGSAAVKVTKRGEGAALWVGEFGGRGVLIAGTEPPDVMELWDWTLGPGDERVSETHATGTRELLHVHQGQVTIDVDGQKITLDVGDAVSFHGDVPHSYANLTRRPARFSLAVFEPGVGHELRKQAPDARLR